MRRNQKDPGRYGCGIIGKTGLERSVISPLIATCLNILLLFVIYTLLRLEFLAENFSYFGETVKEGNLWTLLTAGPVFDTPGIFYLNALYILLMLFPLHWKERPGYYRVCKWFFIIINSVGIIANLADSIYFSYTLRRTTWDVFAEFGGDDNMLKIIGVEMVRHWYLAIFCILLVWGLARLYSTPHPGANIRGKGRYYLLSLLGLIVGGITTVSAIRGGFLNHWWQYVAGGVALYAAWLLLGKERKISFRRRLAGCMALGAGVILIATAPFGGWRHRDIRPVAVSNANRYIRQPYEAALVLNTPFTMIRTIGASPFADPQYMEEAEMKTLYSPEHKASGTLITDSLTGRPKNVVVFILESFGREYIGSLNKDILGEGYKGYAPFLDSLVSVSATWDMMLDNGRKSIEGIPSVLAGIPSFVKPFVLTSGAMNELRGLPRVLGDAGYYTAFFHGARIGSMGFDGIARSIGFSNYFGREDYESETDEKPGEYFDGYWGIWDGPFLQYYARKLSEFPEPFMGAVFTLSSHHPFHVPKEYDGKFPKGTAPIHQTIGYTDNALREFFATAKLQKWYDNTIFVITNDHTNERCFDEYRSTISTFYGPVIIFDPSGRLPRGRQPGIAQQTDIMPTVLGLTGATQDYVAFGKDLFHTPPEESWAVNYAGLYQYVKYGYVLQFDGRKSVGLYRIGDHKMERNLLGSDPATERKMELELKALIQQYMRRMLHDGLTAK
ncbi:MAG: LTA synthase family protein [Muribaculaceae bacterium]|nr:LTA synthase family protein [Muribaculaceae bacterium]